MKIIPAIDLMNGRCVRLLEGRFDRATTYRDDPVAVAGEYRAAGALWLHVVDLDGARTGAPAHTEVVRRIAEESGLSVQLGGGIRSAAQAKAWIDAGVARVVLGSLTVTNPEAVRGILRDLGPERVTLAIDVRSLEDGRTEVAVKGWTEQHSLSAEDAILRYVPDGAKHVLSTDVGRDGTLKGPNVELYRRLLARFPSIELQASGGVQGLDDLRMLRTIGAAGAIVGRALYEGRFTLEEALRC